MTAEQRAEVDARSPAPTAPLPAFRGAV
jgi:hypothetical protein